MLQMYLVLANKFPFLCSASRTYHFFLTSCGRKCLCTCSKHSVLPSTVKLDLDIDDVVKWLPSSVSKQWRADRPCHCRATGTGWSAWWKQACTVLCSPTGCYALCPSGCADTGLYCPRPVTLSCLRAWWRCTSRYITRINKPWIRHG